RNQSILTEFSRCSACDGKTFTSCDVVAFVKSKLDAMPEVPLLGAKLRALRRRENLTQNELAERLGISASYLNLIENNRRPLTAPLLIRLAQTFQLDLQSFAASDEARLVADLHEAFGDPLFDSHGLTNADLRELAVTSPNVARAMITLYRAYA